MNFQPIFDGVNFILLLLKSLFFCHSSSTPFLCIICFTLNLMYEYHITINVDIAPCSTTVMQELWRKAFLVIFMAPTFSARLLDTGISYASGKWGTLSCFDLFFIVFTLHKQIRIRINQCCEEISICTQAQFSRTSVLFWKLREQGMASRADYCKLKVTLSITRISVILTFMGK